MAKDKFGHVGLGHGDVLTPLARETGRVGYVSIENNMKVETPDPHLHWDGRVFKEAIKQDNEKTRVDLLDAEWLEGTGKALAFGAFKYHDHNWRGGFKWSRLIGACMRHLLAIMRREDVDPESGLLHVDHLSCSVMFLAWHIRNKPELDDRWKP